MAFVPTIGQMRMVIKFEQVVKSTDESGGQNEDYQEWFATRGFLQKIDGFRSFQSGYDQLVNRYRLWVYWRNEFEVDISKDVRVVYEARSFSIDHFSMVDEKRKTYYLEITEVR